MRKLLLALTAGAGLLATMGTAHAQYFVYSSVFSPAPVVSTNAGLSLDVINGGTTSATGTPTNIVITTLKPTSTTTDITQFGTVNTDFTDQITIQLVDANGVATSSALTQTFSGHLSGTLNPISDSVNLTSPTLPAAPILFDFGQAGVFQLTIDQFTAPGPPNGKAPNGTLGGHVTLLSPIGGQGGPGTVPEPGSVASLIGMGVSGTLFAFRRRRR